VERDKGFENEAVVCLKTSLQVLGKQRSEKCHTTR